MSNHLVEFLIYIFTMIYIIIVSVLYYITSYSVIYKYLKIVEYILSFILLCLLITRVINIIIDYRENKSNPTINNKNIVSSSDFTASIKTILKTFAEYLKINKKQK